MGSRTLLGVAVGILTATLPACQPTGHSVTGNSNGEVTFNRDVAPIVFANCASCHRPGEAAPFNLLTYDDVRRRASQIAEVTRSRFMPPWPPKEGHGEFANARRLTDQEIQAFEDWTASDAPRGDESDLPPAPEFVEGWQLGPPDLVLESPPYDLPAAGGDIFRNFVVPIELSTPRWVEAIELRPTNPRIMHHARLGVDSSYESVRRDAEDIEPGYEGMAWGQDPDGELVIWAPGMIARPGTPGTAWRLHPKSCLVLHTHMQPSGKKETAQFRVGVHFADQPPRERSVILRIGSRDIDIRAGEANHTVSDTYIVPIDVDVHSIFPHAHSLCRDVRVDTELPDGSQQPLIWIEHFDENWHDNFRFATPVRLPRGTKLVTRSVYDNTDGNVRNRHHPPQRTVYGSNVVDEMSDVYLRVTPVRADQRAMLIEDFNQYERHSKLIGFRKTLEMYPNDPWSREGLAAVYLGLGEPQKAFQLLDERLKLGPAEVHSVVMQGMATAAAGDPTHAEQLFRQAIEMDDAYPLAWFGLGKALAARDQTDEAEAAYRRAIAIAPALADAQLSLAELLMKNSRLDEAAVACDAAGRASPDDANPLLKLAEIRTRQERYAESQQLLEEVHRLAPYTHPPKVLQGVYCFQNGKIERARQLLGEAHAELPDHPVPALFLGQLMRSSQQLDLAREYLNAAASLPPPDNWPASHRKHFLILLHSERFQLAQQLEDEALARAALANWVKAEPENEKVRALYDQFQAEAKP